MIFRSRGIYTPDKVVDGYLEINNGKIVKIGEGDIDGAKDLEDKWIIPGIFDTHNHACDGYSISGKTEEDRIVNTKHYLKGLASMGVTSVFPTLFFTKPDQESLDELTTAISFVGKPVDGARSVGVHYEGPFLNRVGEHGKRYKPDPIDLNYAKKCIGISQGKLKLMGHAPELPGSKEFIKLLLDNGITAAFTHSDCNSQEAFEAFDNGVTVATHTCNVMVGIHHRDIGGLGAALVDDRVYCELICDGMHVCNDMLKLIMKTKPHDHIMLISDSSRFVGAPTGTYHTRTGTIKVDEMGRVLDEDGSLSGSSKPVIYGMKNLVKNVGIDMLDVVKMSALVPCTKYGMGDSKGSLTPGKDADFVIIDRDFNVCETYSEGCRIYDRNIDGNLLNKELMKCME